MCIWSTDCVSVKPQQIIGILDAVFLIQLFQNEYLKLFNPQSKVVIQNL